MPPRWQAIFRPRSERQVQPSVGREKAEARRQDADHRSGNAVYTNLPSEHIGIGIKSLAPVCVGENRDVIGIRSGFFIRERTSHRGAKSKSGEKIRRDSHGLLALG